MTTSEQRKPVNTAAAAAHLNVSPRTMERWRIEGNGPPYRKLGPQIVRYDIADLDQWYAGSRRVSTSDPGPEQQQTA